MSQCATSYNLATGTQTLVMVINLQQSHGLKISWSRMAISYKKF